MKTSGYLFVVIFFLLPAWSAAQQSPHFSMSTLNKYHANPAYSVFSDRLEIAGTHRDQWNNLPGAPSTQLISGHFPLDFGISSLGFEFLNDAIGIERSMALSLSYSHRLSTEFGDIGLGMKFGGEQRSLDQSRIRTPGGSYNEDIIFHDDPLLDDRNLSSIVPVFGFSIWYSSYLGFDAGLSVSQLSAGSHFGGEVFSYDLKPVYSLYVDYFIPFMEDWYVVPSGHVYTDLNQTQVYLHGMASFQDQYFGGLGLRGITPNSLDAVTLMVGFRMNDRFTAYYNYDIGLSNIYRPNNQTHEFSVVYRGGEWPHRRQKPPVIYNPRFME